MTFHFILLLIHIFLRFRVSGIPIENTNSNHQNEWPESSESAQRSSIINMNNNSDHQNDHFRHSQEKQGAMIDNALNQMSDINPVPHRILGSSKMRDRGSASSSMSSIHESILDLKSFDSFDWQLFTKLPLNAASNILEQIHLKKKETPSIIQDRIPVDKRKNLLNLLSTSKQVKIYLKESFELGSFSYLGHRKKFISNIDICKEIWKPNQREVALHESNETIVSNDPGQTNLNQIRELFVTKQVYDACQFQAHLLPNIEKLYIKVDLFSPQLHQDRQVPSSSALNKEETVDWWIKLAKEYTENRPHHLKELEIIDELDHTALHHLILQAEEILPLSTTSSSSSNVHHSLNNASLTLQTEGKNQGMNSKESGESKKQRKMESKLDKFDYMLTSRLVNVNAVAFFAHSPLHFCMASDIVYLNPTMDVSVCIKKLVSHGAKVDIFDFYGFSPVHFAAHRYDNIALEIFLKYNVSVNLQMSPSQSITNPPLPIHNAMIPAFTAYTEEMVKYFELLFATRNRGSLETRQSEWLSKLTENKRTKNTPFYFLINHGADLGVSCLDLLPFHEVILSNDHQMRNGILSLPLENLPINVQDSDGNTLLNKAAKLGYTEIVQLLLDKNADVHITNKADETPLLSATLYSSSVEMVVMLVEKGSDVHRTSTDGMTPLLGALLSDQKSLQMIDYLLGEGVSVHATTNGNNAKAPKTKAHTLIFDFILMSLRNQQNMGLQQGQPENENARDLNEGILIKTLEQLATMYSSSSELGISKQQMNLLNFPEFQMMMLATYGVGSETVIKELLPLAVPQSLRHFLPSPYSLMSGVGLSELAFQYLHRMYSFLNSQDPTFIAKCKVLEHSPWLYPVMQNVRSALPELYACMLRPTRYLRYLEVVYYVDMDQDGQPLQLPLVNQQIVDLKVQLKFYFPNVKINFIFSKSFSKERMSSLEMDE